MKTLRFFRTETTALPRQTVGLGNPAYQSWLRPGSRVVRRSQIHAQFSGSV